MSKEASITDSVVDLGDKGVAIVGAGLVGCLLGVYLRKHGMQVTLFEGRPDPRVVADSGRSINLVITSRGIAALTNVSEQLAQDVMRVTRPVFGRVLHGMDSSRQYQPYGPDASYCNFSVSRWELNCVLMTAAERAGCRIFFSHPLAHLDVDSGTLFFYLQHQPSTQLYQKRVKAGHIFGCDGGGSRVRQALKGRLGEACSDKALPLRYGYKELTMPRPPASAAMDGEALHIWPRGSHFVMALPNCDGSMTVTLYMQEQGPVSFASLDTPEKVRAYFKEFYADAIPLMPQLEEQYHRNPVGFLGTVFCSPWTSGSRVVLLGDAAHGITPFFGQGCNCGFEDVAVLDELLKKKGVNNLTEVLKEWEALRKPDADAIANMALENFTEMMSKTADAHFLLQKEVENDIQKRFPEKYAARYTLITHSLVRYSICKEIGVAQQKMLDELCAGIKSAKEVDFAKVPKLIDQYVTPILKKHNISPAQFNFVSKYYPKPTARL